VNLPDAPGSPGSALEPERTTDLPAAPESPPPAAPPMPADTPPPIPTARHPDIPLVPTARLLAASFDLLGRSATDMRRASFYVGLIVLGTVGPLALASWGLLVVETSTGFADFEEGIGTNAEALFFGLGLLAFVGLVVAWVESRSLAVTVLGGRMVERPVSTRRGLARSRRMFWSAIVASSRVSSPRCSRRRSEKRLRRRSSPRPSSPP
jgi:hypothetical protein